MVRAVRLSTSLPETKLPSGGRFVTDSVVTVMTVKASGTSACSFFSWLTDCARVVRLMTFVVTNSVVPKAVRVMTRNTVVIVVLRALKFSSTAISFRRSIAEQVSSFPRLLRNSVTIVFMTTAISFIAVMTLNYLGAFVSIGYSCVTRKTLVPITAVERRQVSIGAGVVTVCGS